MHLEPHLCPSKLQGAIGHPLGPQFVGERCQHSEAVPEPQRVGGRKLVARSRGPSIKDVLGLPEVQRQTVRQLGLVILVDDSWS